MYTIYRIIENRLTIDLTLHSKSRLLQCPPQLTNSPLFWVEFQITCHPLDVVAVCFHEGPQVLDFARRHMARASTR